MNLTQMQIIDALERFPGRHCLGPALAKYCAITPRALRKQIRTLRYDHGRWDILSRPGGCMETDGYWISQDAAEIEANRKYYERQGMDHLSRASHMQPKRSEPIAAVHGQRLMEFVA